MSIITKRVTSLNESNSCLVPDDYEKVNVFTWHSKDSKYYELSPYFLKTDGKEELQNNGNILFENFWQGSKVYPIVYPIEIFPHYTLKSNRKYLSWEWTTTNYHILENKVQENYFEWRQSIFNCNKPLRYPNGIKNRKSCAFSLLGDKRLNYIQARKEIYVKEYSRLIRNTNAYKTLLTKLCTNKNLCIIEIDVPSYDKTGMWKSNENNICYMSLDFLYQLQNQETYPFGHGLVLSMCLLEDSKDSKDF